MSQIDTNGYEAHSKAAFATQAHDPHQERAAGAVIEGRKVVTPHNNDAPHPNDLPKE